MKKFISKFNKARSTKFQQNGGFTLVETMVAILVLSVSISAMLNLSASNFFSVRYSRNDIVGNNLVQEAVEYIRNSRDTAYLGDATSISSWKTSVVDVCSSAINPNGCMVDSYNKTITACSSQCDPLYFFNDNGNKNFYGYNTGSISNSIQTTYVRTVKIRNGNIAGHYIVDITLSWQNGLNQKSISQTVNLTDWNI